MSTATQPTTIAIKLTPASSRTTIAIPPSTLKAIATVGTVVTWSYNQYRVHSVEGADFYAFEAEDGTIMVDMNMAHMSAFESPVAVIIPMWSRIGQGHSVQIQTNRLERGVCLDKSYK